MLSEMKYCPVCGAAVREDGRRTKVCANGHCHYDNPIPVVVVLLPIETDGGKGVLVIKRGIEPCLGQWALPGGYIECGETWRESAAREVWEETGLRISPAALRCVRLESSVDNTLLLVLAVAQSVSEREVAGLKPTPEASELRVIKKPEPLAFRHHYELLQEFFAAQAPE